MVVQFEGQLEDYFWFKSVVYIWYRVDEPNVIKIGATSNFKTRFATMNSLIWAQDFILEAFRVVHSRRAERWIHFYLQKYWKWNEVFECGRQEFLIALQQFKSIQDDVPYPPRLEQGRVTRFYFNNYRWFKPEQDGVLTIISSEDCSRVVVTTNSFNTLRPKLCYWLDGPLVVDFIRDIDLDEHDLLAYLKKMVISDYHVEKDSILFTVGGRNRVLSILEPMVRYDTPEIITVMNEDSDYLYIWECLDDPGRVKVGTTENIQDRSAELERYSLYTRGQMVLIRRRGSAWEKVIHQILTHRWICNEWFLGTTTDIVNELKELPTVCPIAQKLTGRSITVLTLEMVQVSRFPNSGEYIVVATDARKQRGIIIGVNNPDRWIHHFRNSCSTRESFLYCFSVKKPYWSRVISKAIKLTECRRIDDRRFEGDVELVCHKIRRLQQRL